MARIKLLPFVYVLMLGIIFILPFYSAPGYSIISNTTSQLGAQATHNAWIMNLVFILLAVSSIIDGWPKVKGYPWHKILLGTFGLALIGTAIFSHAPITPGVEYNVWADQRHSNFADLTGFAFSFLAVATGFIEKTKKRRIIAFSVGFGATLLSVLFFRWPEFAGIWQRIIFCGSFAWLIYFSQGGNNE